MKDFSDDGLRQVGFPDPRRQRQTIRKGNALFTESDEAYRRRMAALDAEKSELEALRVAEYQAAKAKAEGCKVEQADTVLPDGNYTLTDGFACQIWHGGIYTGHGNAPAAEWLGSSKKVSSLSDLERAVSDFWGNAE